MICTGTPILAPVRLAGSENSYEGRVEIWYSGVWGTICDEDWDSTDAIVVCRMLGLRTEGARGIAGARYATLAKLYSQRGVNIDLYDTIKYERIGLERE